MEQLNKNFPFPIPEESEKSIKKEDFAEINPSNRRLFIKKIIKITLIVSLIFFVASYFFRYKLPSKSLINNYLYNEPNQEEINIPPFEVQKGGISYKIDPKYSYEIRGLIVADYNSENLLDIFHKKDPLNSKDVCIVWGDNIKNGVYQKMKFSHGEFTCYAKAKFGENASLVYPLFFWDKGSNNHLLPKDESIYKKIKEAKIGDQIYLKGYLVDYAVSENGNLIGSRTTSTIRTDTGNGACEIIYVEDFQILEKANQFWRFINSYFGYLIIIFLICAFVI